MFVVMWDLNFTNINSDIHEHVPSIDFSATVQLICEEWQLL
jgi:hypothetical protein